LRVEDHINHMVDCNVFETPVETPDTRGLRDCICNGKELKQ